MNVSNFLRFLWRHSNYKMAVFLLKIYIKNFLRYKFANVMLYKLCKRIFLNSIEKTTFWKYICMTHQKAYNFPANFRLNRA